MSRAIHEFSAGAGSAKSLCARLSASNAVAVTKILIHCLLSSEQSLLRFRIDFGEHSNLGPGRVALLEGIKTHGSLSETARSMGISYRRAWLLLVSVNRSFVVPATINSAGGRGGGGGGGGGGAEITAFVILLIERYREVERKLNVIANALKTLSGKDCPT